MEPNSAEDLASIRTPNSSNLLSDEPLTDPSQDQLGRAAFAEALARAILKMPGEDGFVFAIYAPWGSGKSTTLNFIQKYIAKNSKKEDIFVVRFDPWWYPGEKQLILQFFNQVTLSLGRHSALEGLKKLGSMLEVFAKAITPLSYLPVAKDFVAPGAAALKSSGEAVTAAAERLAQDVEHLRKVVEKILRDQKTRILIVIDDLDRLNEDEIRQMFQLIKAVAGFPFITYLLSFDREMIAKALSSENLEDGRSYLEKIVQAPFDRLPVDKYALQALLCKELDLVIGEPDAGLWDSVAWGNVFTEGILPMIRTLREMKRYVNAVRVTYPAVQGEVNPVDFLAMECLRVFTPRVYDAVYAHKDIFIRVIPQIDLSDGKKSDELVRQYEEVVQTASEEKRAAVQQILKRTFPKFAHAFGESHYGTEWEQEWSKKLLVRSSDRFETYFCFSVPKGAISQADMKALLEVGGDAQAFADALLKLADEKWIDGQTARSLVALERLEVYTKEDIPTNHIQPILLALYQVGDRLMTEHDEAGHFFLGTDRRIMRITYQLLMRIDMQKRSAMLREVLEDAESLYASTMQVSLVDQHFEERRKKGDAFQQEDYLIQEEQISKLQSQAVEKIRHAALAGRLASIPRLMYVLYRWRDWSGPSEPKAWVESYIESDKGMVELLARSLGEYRSHQIGDSVDRVQFRVNVESLADFVPDVETLRTRAAAILKENPSWLTERQQLALTVFVERKQKHVDWVD